MARVNEGSVGHTALPATQTISHKWNEPYLPLLRSHTCGHCGTGHQCRT